MSLLHGWSVLTCSGQCDCGLCIFQMWHFQCFVGGLTCLSITCQVGKVESNCSIRPSPSAGDFYLQWVHTLNLPSKLLNHQGALKIALASYTPWKWDTPWKGRLMLITHRWLREHSWPLSYMGYRWSRVIVVISEHMFLKHRVHHSCCWSLPRGRLAITKEELYRTLAPEDLRKAAVLCK